MFDSVAAPDTDLTTIIQNDRQYGVFRPKNGKTITWALKNTDTELNYRQMKKIIEDVITAYIIEFELDFERITDYSKADLKLSFSTVAEDENLDANTIAYMGYPLTGSPFWGICVINKSFTYSHDGKPLTGEEMIKKGIQVQFPNATYQTLYLVKILMHEFGHGILGLPHDPRRGSVMSYSEGTMSEYWSDRDLVRGYAKVKRKTRSQSMLDRLRAWFKIGGKR